VQLDAIYRTQGATNGVGYLPHCQLLALHSLSATCRKRIEPFVDTVSEIEGMHRVLPLYYGVLVLRSACNLSCRGSQFQIVLFDCILVLYILHFLLSFFCQERSSSPKRFVRVSGQLKYGYGICLPSPIPFQTTYFLSLVVWKSREGFSRSFQLYKLYTLLFIEVRHRAPSRLANSAPARVKRLMALSRLPLAM
jgi:hypothetical protein